MAGKLLFTGLEGEVLTVRVEVTELCAAVPLVAEFVFLHILPGSRCLVRIGEILIGLGALDAFENMWVLFCQLLKHFGAVLRRLETARLQLY